MKQELYLCDNCKKVLSKTGKRKIHLSMNFSDKYNGWVAPENNWLHQEIVEGIHHFCNGTCLGIYYDEDVRYEWIEMNENLAFIRSGTWNNDADDGCFTLNLTGAPSLTVTYVGFRCCQ